MFEERFTTKPPEHGTGLGLSIVKRLVREAGGAIIIQIQLGSRGEIHRLPPDRRLIAARG